MTEEMLEAAREAVRNPKPSSAVALDSAALRSARNMPVVVNLSPIISFLSGAGGQAQNADQYYQNAATQSGQYYQDALNKLVSSTGTGSPAAQTFANEEVSSLQPLFNQQAENLAAKESSLGLTGSGAAQSDLGNLSNEQSATLAGAIGPLFQQALGQYGNILGTGAGAQSGLVGQGAGAANNAYNQSINDFYQSLQAGAGAYGGGSFGGGGGSTSYSNEVPGNGGVGSNQAYATY